MLSFLQRAKQLKQANLGKMKWYLMFLQSLLLTTVKLNGVQAQDQNGMNEHHLRINEHQSLPLELTIPDDTRPGTLILSPVPNSGALIQIIVTDQNQRSDHAALQYQILESSSNDDSINDHFQLDPGSGNLTLTDWLNSDSCRGQNNTKMLELQINICNHDDNCSNLKLTISLTPTKCTPTFDTRSVHLTVNESTPVGANINLGDISCNVPGNYEHMLRIISRDHTLHCQVLETFGIINSTLVLLQPLDYEDIQSYSLLLNCSNQRGHDVASVIVDVLPDNDNAPMFEKQWFVFNITDQRSLQIQASDNDRHSGNTISYHLRPNFELGQTHSLENHFLSLDSQSGTLHNLNAITEDLTVFDIEATDGKFSAQCTVVLLKIQDGTETKREAQQGLFCSNQFVGYVLISALAITVVTVLCFMLILICICYKWKKLKRKGNRVLNHCTTDREVNNYPRGIPQSKHPHASDCCDVQDDTLEFNYVNPEYFKVQPRHTTPNTGFVTYDQPQLPKRPPNKETCCTKTEHDEYLQMCPSPSVTRRERVGTVGLEATPAAMNNGTVSQIPSESPLTRSTDFSKLRVSVASVDNIYDFIN